MRTILCEAVVGREEDLDTARRSLEQAGRANGSLLCVLGEAGVGKSRLARDIWFRETVQELHGVDFSNPPPLPELGMDARS